MILKLQLLRVPFQFYKKYGTGLPADYKVFVAGQVGHCN